MSRSDAHQRNSADSTLLINALQETLLNSFYKLGLTENQESFLQNMVSDFIARMAELLNRGVHAGNPAATERPPRAVAQLLTVPGTRLGVCRSSSART